MRTWLMIGSLTALCALAADKSLPNQAGNAKLSLSGTAITDRKAVTELMGIDLGEGYIVVRILTTPQTPQPIRVSADDFTLVSRKNGEKSGAMAPTAIAGSGAIVVMGAPSQSGESVGATNGPSVPLPVGGNLPMGRNGGGVGNSGSVEGGMVDIRTERRRDEDPRLAFLEAKAFQDRETREPVEGLLYFNLEQKLKPKDVGLIYSGPAGRMVIDFK